MSENTQPRYYVLKPVSEKPEKDDYYHIIDELTMLPGNPMYFKGGNWFETKEDADWIDFVVNISGAYYLSPVTEDELAKEVEELREWQRQAMAVMPDYQAIAKVLEIPLGQSVHDKILSALESLREKCARYDQLRDEVAQFNSEDHDDNEADLLDIGEVTANHFKHSY